MPSDELGMKLTSLALVGALVLVSGEAFDIATTAIGLLHPAPTGYFVEVGNPFVMLLMYDLGLAPTIGFLIGISSSVAFDVILIYFAFSWSGSYSSPSVRIALEFMFLAGVLHWLAGYHNLLLYREHASFGF
jgi:hypothetical protein